VRVCVCGCVSVGESVVGDSGESVGWSVGC